MADDAQSPRDEPDEELTLPSDDAKREAARQRKTAAIPQRAKPSGMVRRQVSVGNLKRGEAEPFQGHDTEAGRTDHPKEPEGEAETGQGETGLQKAPNPERPVVREGKEIGTATPPKKPIETRSDASEAAGSPQRRHRRTRDPEGEDAWTGASSSLWFVLVGILCVTVVAYFLVSGFKKLRPEPTPEPPKRNIVKDSIDEIPIAEFVERSAELLPIVAELVDKAERVEQDGGEELPTLVRGGAESVARMKKWRAQGAKPARHRPLTLRELHAAAVGGRGYLVLAGLDADYLLSAAYFVMEGENLKYDWEASEGYSEFLLSEVDQLPEGEPKLLRAVVSRSDFYPEPYPEEEYRCYTFHQADPGVYAFGFAKRSSHVDRSLMASFLAPDLKGTERRATVKVRKGPPGSRPNQLEVVEFLHTDWLTP